MEKKKNTGLIITIIILVVALFGTSGYIVYDKVLSNNKTNETKEENNDIIDEENKEEQNEKNSQETVSDGVTISKESINELSKNKSLNINNDFTDVDKIAGSIVDSNKINDILYLSVNSDNKLILKYNNNSSVITNLDEEIVMLYNANYGCQFENFITLILTNKGNIYSFNNYYIKDYLKANSYLLENIKNNRTSNIPLTKINDNYKVLAFTNYTRQIDESNPITCGGMPPIVYTEDRKFMEIHPEENTMTEYVLK